MTDGKMSRWAEREDGENERMRRGSYELQAGGKKSEAYGKGRKKVKKGENERWFEGKNEKKKVQRYVILPNFGRRGSETRKRGYG